MRYWIEYLLGNPSACEDFIKWAKEAENNLNAKLGKAVQSNDIEKARGIAHEIVVYETLRQRIEAEIRERTAQATYEEQIEGRQ
jgi:hypothetical protein